MSDQVFEFRQPPEPGRSSTVQKFVDVLRGRPGEWAVYRTGMKQNNAHVQASAYRKRYPGVIFVARKDEDGTHAIFGKIEG